MKKTLKIILALGCVAFACAGAVACKEDTKLEAYQKAGYTVSVTYDGNGGKFLGRNGITIVDLFKPSDYKDENGEVHIKLTEPTSSDRTSGGDTVTLTNAGHFLVGWYQTREVKEINGVPVDENGRALKALSDGTYVYAELQEGEKNVSVTPAYEYSDYWDFEKDVLEYKSGEGLKNITLYAGWLPDYEFNYYYEQDGEWTKLDKTTTFDYTTANDEASDYSDRDVIQVPEWGENGAMNHTFKYVNGAEYSFPKIENTTFESAYTDKECTQKIEGSLQHAGTLDYETCTATNRVQNVYIKVSQGEQFRITSAKQLAENATLTGYYEIRNDLDFYDAEEDEYIEWAFNYGTFEGKMYGMDGATYKLKNIFVTHSSPSATQGGLFGAVAKDAEIKNLVFENVTFDLSYTGQRVNDTSFGLFAGFIEEDADIENVMVGGTFKIGAITLGENAQFNLYANGDTSGLIKEKVKLQIYGMDLDGEYLFYILPYDKTDATKKTVTVDESYNVTVTPHTGETFEKGIYDIEYQAEVNQNE